MKLEARLDDARAQMQLLDEAKGYLNSVFSSGAMLEHSRYGKGIVKSNSGTSIKVEFANGEEKVLGTAMSAVKGFITSDTEGYAEHMEKYKKCLEKESSIKTALSIAEREMRPYVEYLE